MNTKENTTYPTTSIGRFWIKLPIVIRAIILGFVVNTLGVGTWILSITFIPAPWSILVMGIILIFYWKYFSGKWKPINTQLFRMNCFRLTKLSKVTWIWGVLASLCLFIFLNSGLMMTFRLVEFQPDVFKTARYLNDLPLWISWAFIIMASMVAGICEEVGFRGYMQVPLEKKFGPIIGIVITSVVFVIVHLHQAWAGGVLIHIFVVSVMIGYLAYSTNSLLPGIIAHICFDIVNFSYWWSDVMGTFELKPIGMTGIDNHFIIVAVIVGASSILFIVAIRKLLRMKDFANNGF